MQTFKYVIKDELGIHARPAGLLVKEAKNFNSTITLESNGKKGAAKGLMASTLSSLSQFPITGLGACRTTYPSTR